MSDEHAVSHWIDRAKAGDPAAADSLWRCHFDRLVRAVRRRLGGQNRAVSDEEDVVLSVFDSFLRGRRRPGGSRTFPTATTFGGC